MWINSLLFSYVLSYNEKTLKYLNSNYRHVKKLQICLVSNSLKLLQTGLSLLHEVKARKVFLKVLLDFRKEQE